MARVLIVDDEEADRVVLRTILERSHHEVFEAGDGDEAIAAFDGNPIEVVVTDLQMQNVHGLELITLLRELDPRPGIVAISGTGEVQLDMAQALGATKTLSKPIVPEQLLSAVDEVLGRRAAGPGTQAPA